MCDFAPQPITPSVALFPNLYYTGVRSFIRGSPLLDLDTCNWEAWTHSGIDSNRNAERDLIYIYKLRIILFVPCDAIVYASENTFVLCDAGYKRRGNNCREAFFYTTHLPAFRRKNIHLNAVKLLAREVVLINVSLEE